MKTREISWKTQNVAGRPVNLDVRGYEWFGFDRKFYVEAECLSSMETHDCGFRIDEDGWCKYHKYGVDQKRICVCEELSAALEEEYYVLKMLEDL